MKHVSGRILGLLWVVLATGLFPLPCYAFDVSYQVVDLGVLAPGGTSAGLGISNSNQVAGYGLNLSTNIIAAVTNKSGQLTELGALGSGRTSAALAISPGGGVVVGESEVLVKSNPNIYATHAFEATGPGAIIDLQDPTVTPRFPNSDATGINDAGRIVGYVQSANKQTTLGFVSDTPGVMTVMGTLGGQNSQANGVNAQGLIVGTSDTASGVSHAFITADGVTLTDLGLPGSSTGMAINDLGHVVGGVGPAGGSSRSDAFFSTGVGKYVDLGVLSGTDTSVAMAINNSDVLVGTATQSNTGLSSAFVDYQPGKSGSLINLNSLIDPNSGWVLNSATGINAMGNITGTGTFNGQTRAFLLVAVPEPSMLVLSTVGITCGLGLALRKRVKPRG